MPAFARGQIIAELIKMRPNGERGWGLLPSPVPMSNDFNYDNVKRYNIDVMLMKGHA